MATPESFAAQREPETKSFRDYVESFSSIAPHRRNVIWLTAAGVAISKKEIEPPAFARNGLHGLEGFRQIQAIAEVSGVQAELGGRPSFEAANRPDRAPTWWMMDDGPACAGPPFLVGVRSGNSFSG